MILLLQEHELKNSSAKIFFSYTATSRRRKQLGRTVLGKNHGVLPPNTQGFGVEGSKEFLFSGPKPVLLKYFPDPVSMRYYKERRKGPEERRKADLGKKSKKKLSAQ